MTEVSSKSVDWFLYYRDLRHERVNAIFMRYRKEISSMKAATPQNGQTHLKNSSATTGELFEYV